MSIRKGNKSLNLCKKHYLKGTIMYGSKGGMYFLVKPKDKSKQTYKRYCKLSKKNTNKLANNVLHGLRI